MSVAAIAASVRINPSVATQTPKTDTATTGTATAAPKAPQAAAVNSAVSLSLANAKEATETAAETAQEAQKGDIQAKHLIEKHQQQAGPVTNSTGQLTGTIINTKA
jgi:hypothetical protein